MSAQGAAGALVVVGGTYLAVESIAEVLAVGYVGVAIAIVAAALLVMLTLATFVFTIGRAALARDKAWLFDIAAAPLLASGLAWVLYPLYVRIIKGFIGFLRAAPNWNPFPTHTFSGFVGFFVFAIMMIVVLVVVGALAAAAVVSAPFGAVFLMASEERGVRFGSYACYIFTAFYWQTAVIASGRGIIHW